MPHVVHPVEHFMEIFCHVLECVKAREISGAEYCRFGAAHAGSQDRIDLANTITFVNCPLNSREKAISADTISDKIWCVFTMDNAFTQHFTSESFHKYQHFR